MKLFLTLVVLIVTVLLAEKYESRLFPPFSWIFSAWKKFAHVLGMIMSTILLTILWLVGFGAYAIALKIASVFQSSGPRDSYWIHSEAHTPENMQRQF